MWYPTVLKMAVQMPIILPNTPTLIMPTRRVNKPDIILPLAVWVISEIDSKAKPLWKKVQNFSLPHGGKKHQKRMIPYLANSWAGIAKGTPIPFQEI